MYTETAGDYRIYYQDCVAKVGNRFIMVNEFYQDEDDTDDDGEPVYDGSIRIEFTNLGNGHSFSEPLEDLDINFTPLRIGWHNINHTAVYLGRNLNVESPSRYRVGLNNSNTVIKDLWKMERRHMGLEYNFRTTHNEFCKLVDNSFKLTPHQAYESVFEMKRYSSAFDHYAIGIMSHRNTIAIYSPNGVIGYVDDNGVLCTSQHNYECNKDYFTKHGLEIKVC
jgi:hypothetical protein